MGSSRDILGLRLIIKDASWDRTKRSVNVIGANGEAVVQRYDSVSVPTPCYAIPFSTND